MAQGGLAPGGAGMRRQSSAGDKASIVEAALMACLAAWFTWMELAGTRVGGLFAPLLGDLGPAEPGLARNLIVAVLLAGAIWANIAIVRLLPFRPQVIVIWLELLLLFVAFIDSFERDLGIWF